LRMWCVFIVWFKPVLEMCGSTMWTGARGAAARLATLLLACASCSTPLSAGDRHDHGRALRFERVQRLGCPPRTTTTEEVSCVPRPEPLDARTTEIFSSSSRTAWRATELQNLSRAWRRTYQRGHFGFRKHALEPPPRVPPPNGTTLSPSVCASMLANRSQASFRSFWGVPWRKMSPLCMPLEPHRMLEWVNEMEAGVACGRNWFSGVGGGCVDQLVLPAWTGPAPAAIGFDDKLAERCADRKGRPDAPLPAALLEHGGRKRSCIHKNLNVLALFSQAPSYDLCRNLEWLVCAARGALPGQAGRGILADPPPQRVRIDALWHHSALRGSALRYSSYAVYPLEVCILSALCSNRAELFRLGPDQPFRCRWQASALRRVVFQMAEGYVGDGQRRIPTAHI
jgi:hypothetical protein